MYVSKSSQVKLFQPKPQTFLICNQVGLDTTKVQLLLVLSDAGTLETKSKL